MKDTQTKPPNSKAKSKSGILKTKMPAKKLKEQKTKVSKAGKTRNSTAKSAKKPKAKKEVSVTPPKRKRGRPKQKDSTQTKKKIKAQQKTPKNTESKPVSRKRKMPTAVNIKCEKELSHPPPKKPKMNDTSCNMNGNIKTVFPNLSKPCHQKNESPSLEHSATNHVNTNGTFPFKKNATDSKKQPLNNSVLKNATFIPQPLKKEKELVNGKNCPKIPKSILNKDPKTVPKSQSGITPPPKNITKEIKSTKVNNIFIPFKEPIKLHPQRMASLDAMAKLHVICIPDRKPIEHHSRTTTSVVTVCSQPSSHQKSVTQVHERIHFDLKKEGKDFKGNIVHKQINYVKEKQEVYVSHSVEQSSVLEQSNTSSIKSEKDTEKKKTTKSFQKSACNSVQKKDLKLNQSASKSSDTTKSEKKLKANKNNELVKFAKINKVSKPIKKPAKEKQVAKGNNNKTKKLEQTKSEVKVKETIRMQKTCTYQSVTTVNSSHGTTNSSVVPVNHVGLTTNYSKTKKTVVTDEECKNNLNYSSGSVINKSYCVTSESPCSLGHQTDCCKYHTHSTPQIIPFAHVQTCALGHSLNRTSDSSSSSPSRCDGSFSIHRFGHQQPLIYSSPSQECGCCCSSSLVQNVRDPCLLRKGIMTYPHHFPHHAHLPAGTFTPESFCTEYHPTTTSIDGTRHHAQHFTLSPSVSHPRASCCSCYELHSESNQCHHQSASNCLQYVSSPKSSTSVTTCETSPLDLSLASATTGSSLETDHSLTQGHCPSPLCCAGEVLLLRTSTPHGFQHTTFPHKSPCCRCSKPVACENSGIESAQCTSKSLEKCDQTLQLAGNIALQSPSADKSLVPIVPPSTSVVNKDEPPVITDNLVQAKLEKSISPKQSSKTPVPKKRQFSHGWSWKGKPREKLIALTNDSTSHPRMCFPSVQHKEGDVISERDCVLLRSGPKDTDLPYVAKVTSLWENPEDGEMMMSLLWYYRPEHTDQGRKSGQMEDEVFASRHKDVNSIACIEDKCYVLTYNEYCRYRASLTMEDDVLSVSTIVVPDLPDQYSRTHRLPAGAVSNDIVFFCRHVYDFRQKRILKNPT